MYFAVSEFWIKCFPSWQRDMATPIPDPINTVGRQNKPVNLLEKMLQLLLELRLRKLSLHLELQSQTIYAWRALQVSMETKSVISLQLKWIISVFLTLAGNLRMKVSRWHTCQSQRKAWLTLTLSRPQPGLTLSSLQPFTLTMRLVLCSLWRKSARFAATIKSCSTQMQPRA